MYYQFTENELRKFLGKEAIAVALGNAVGIESETFRKAIVDFCRFHEVKNLNEYIDNEIQLYEDMGMPDHL